MTNDKVVMIIPLSVIPDLKEFEDVLIDSRILVKFVTDDEFQSIMKVINCEI